MSPSFTITLLNLHSGIQHFVKIVKIIDSMSSIIGIKAIIVKTMKIAGIWTIIIGLGAIITVTMVIIVMLLKLASASQTPICHLSFYPIQPSWVFYQRHFVSSIEWFAAAM